MAPISKHGRGPNKTPRNKPATNTKFELDRLEEREVPATLSGTIFLDTNTNGTFDTTAPVINNVGAGTTPLALESGYTGLNQPWDSVATRTPVTIQAFDNNNVLAGSTTSAADGTYTVTVATAGNYRLEFTNLPAGVSFGPSGANSGTSVQFVNAATTTSNTPNLNLGLVRYEDITPDNPLLATNIYVFGANTNPTTGGNPTVVSYPYNSGSSNPVPNPPGNPGDGNAGPYLNPTDHVVQITHSQVGATWGLAYNRATNQIYMSAFTKQHTGYGPSGIGAIYAAGATPTGNNTTVTTANTLVDLNSIFPGAAGTDYRLDSDFTLAANTGGTDPYVRDGLYIKNGVQVGWDSVGKNGLGGLDVDPSGRYLFTVALGDRKLYIIDTTNPTISGITSVNLPILGGATGYTGTGVNNLYGDMRPFAVQYYRGSIYVGAVNSAESTTLGGTVTGDATKLRGYVFQYKLNTNGSGALTGTGNFVDVNGANSTTSAVLDISLNYNRGYIQPGIASANQPVTPVSANWLPWTPVYKNITNANLPNIGFYPQPVLTGLAFDEQGNITIGLRDRSGDQFGVQTPKDVNNPNNIYVGISAGDTLRAFTDVKTTGNVVTSRWTLESNGRGPASSGTVTSANGVGNNQGPGGGEFYSGDFLVPGLTNDFEDHQELTVGGVLQLPGYADVAVTTFDPAQISKRYNAGGVRWFRNIQEATNRAGDMVRGYELYKSSDDLSNPPIPTFAKSNGVGDLVAIRQSPMEIGNRVWIDLNRDGRQDASDPGLAGVVVILYKNGQPIGTATTDANGNYYFSSLSDPGAGLRVPGKAYGINVIPNMDYQVQISLTQPALQPFTLTTTKINGGTEPTRDSDASGVNGQGIIDLSTGLLGSNVHTFDAGVVYNLSIGDFVWYDKNNDGVWDNSETALQGVTVELLNAGGTAISSTVTNAQGGYIFTGLNAGTYSVRIPLSNTVNPILQGYLSSTGVNGSTTGAYEPANGIPVAQPNNQDNGVRSGNFVVGAPINLQPGTAPLGETTALNGTLSLTDPATDANSYRTMDFGFYLPVTIGDRVFIDANNSGMRDPGELDLQGVTVELLQVNGATATSLTSTVTNASGGYLFTNLAPGNYQVRLVRNAALNGYVSSTGSLGRATGPFEPVVGNPADDKDHGTQATGFINGPVLNATIGGTTAADPANFPTGLPADPAQPTSSYRNQDFGVYQPLELGNLVFFDVNNDGVVNNGETGVANIVVELLDANGNPVLDSSSAPITTTTAGDGTYLFTNLVAGQYRIRITPPSGYMTSTGTNGSLTGPYEPGLPGSNTTDNADHGTMVANSTQIISSAVTLSVAGNTANPDTSSTGLANAANLRQDFGIYRKVSVGDFVWNDSNNNGMFDTGESAIAGVTVRLLDGAGNPVLGAGGTALTTTTASDGGYLFANLTPGRYQIEVVTPAGFISSSGTTGSTSGPFEPVTGNPVNNKDHGTTQPGGVVRGPVLDVQPGLAPTDDTDGPASVTLIDTVANDSSYRNQDFGFFRPLSIGDLVWLDSNNNGSVDTGEPGIGGVMVFLLDASGATIASTTTNSDGIYGFSNLNAGNYTVQIMPPLGYFSSTGGTGNPFEPAAQNNINNTDKGTTQASGKIQTAPLTLLDTGNPDANGTANLRQDFGLYQTLAIGDLVWVDANNSGMFDAGEAPLANVPVRLLDASGNVIASTTTNASGLYLFSNLLPGTYSVEITAPAGYTSSTGGTGSPFEPAPQNNINDKDKGTTQSNGTIKTLPFNLTATGNPDNGGLANLRQDFGLFVPPTVPPVVPPPTTPLAMVSGYVYVDSNINGVKDANEKPIPGTRVYLNGVTDTGTTISQTALTDVNGFYKFTDLPVGNYIIREQQPEGTLYNGSTNVGTIGGTLVGTGGNDIIRSIRLNANDNGVNYNFGEIPNAATFGYVWVDSNLNGIFDTGETPIQGVAVTISGTAFEGTPFARPLTAADVPGGLTVFTNSQGRYDFPTLPYGNYKLTETQPVDYDDWKEQDGAPDGPRPTITNDMFTGVILSAAGPIRGPFNFGEILSSSGNVPPTSPQVPEAPTKRDFLSSTTNVTRAASTAAVSAAPVQDTPGVVSAVGNYNLQPKFPVTGLSPNKPTYVASGAGQGSAPLVRVFDYASGLERFRFLAYEQGYTGGVRTAVGDINGDGVPDIITATGFGGGPRIRAFSGVDGSVLQDFFAFESSYVGGLSVTVADYNGDGFGDIIVGTDVGGGPRVRVFNGSTNATIVDFFAFDPNQRGGVRVAAADMNGDGRADIIASTGAGVPTMVRVYNAVDLTILREITPYMSQYTGGVFVSAGDFNGDGTPDIITGTDVGGGPQVNVFDGKTGNSLTAFFAFESSFTGGVRVSAVDIDGDGKTEIVAAAGSGGGARVVVYSAAGLNAIDDFFAFDATVTGGSYVSGGAVVRKTTPSASTGQPVASGQLGKPGTLPTI
jgi:SdrD B-like domain/FG-GAP-like repeat